MTNIETLNIDSTILEKLINDCQKGLFICSPTPIIYPKELKQGNDDWDNYSDIILKLNANLLTAIKNQANVYAIYKRNSSEFEWQPVYIGQRKAKNIRSRIVEHFIKKHHLTGSKLAEIKDVIKNDGEVAVSFIKVEPDSLRLFVEESLIQKNKSILLWNINQ